MSNRPLCGRHRRHLINRRQGRASDQITWQTKGAGGMQFGTGGCAATIFGDYQLHAVIPQQCLLGSNLKRPSTKQIIDLRQCQRRRHRVNTADQIVMLRRDQQRRQFLTTKGDKNPLRAGSNLAQCRSQVIDHPPVVISGRLPWWPADRQMRQAYGMRRRRCMFRHLLGEGMRRINQQVDSMIVKVADQSRHATKATAAGRHRLRQWPPGSTGKRQGDGQGRGVRQFAGQQAGLCGTAQNQDMMAHDCFYE